MKSPITPLVFSLLLCSWSALADPSGNTRTNGDWIALLKLAQELPMENPDADPSFMATQGEDQFLAPLKDCSYDPAETRFMDCLLKTFEDGMALPVGKQKDYIVSVLRKLPDLSWKDRMQLELGVRADIGMTRAGVTNHNCAAYLKMQFLNGLTRDEMSKAIRSKIQKAR